MKNDWSVKTHLLSASEIELLRYLTVDLGHSHMEFNRELNFIEMLAVGHILENLDKRTDQPDQNHINFFIGKWISYAEDWFGKGIGIRMAMSVQHTPSYSCFISYNDGDKQFADKLYTHLSEANVSVWYAPESVQGGRKIRDQVEAALLKYDRILAILSENSLQSQWVLSELRLAHKLETDQKRDKLFPIRITSIENIKKWECFDADTGRDIAKAVREYHIFDFSDWNDPDKFQAAFAKLLDDLKAVSDTEVLKGIVENYHNYVPEDEDGD